MLKKYLILFFALLLHNYIYAEEFDFEVNGIMYRITSETNKEVCVTNYSPNNMSTSTFEKWEKTYIGDIVIPSTVIYNNSSYTVTSIDNQTFQQRKLTSITLPNTIKTIGYQAFCISNISSINLPNSITSIGENIFAHCLELKSVKLSNQLKEIPHSAFSRCTSLTDVIIPSSISTIGPYAFLNCTALKTIEIPSDVTNIKDGAFQNCKDLQFVYSYITNPFNIFDNVFENISSSAVLHVPHGTKSLYQNYSGWTNFSSIVDDLENSSVTTYTLSVSASGGGYASYSGSSVRGTTSTFTLDEGTSATISFSPDDGYRIASVSVNGSSMGTSSSITVTMNSNITVSVVFEEIPVVTYEMTITAKGNGEASYSGSSLRDGTRTFKVNEGSNPRVTFSPDLGNRTKTVKLNGSDVSFSDNRYTISNVRSDNTLEVEFEELDSKFTSDGFNYEVSSFENMAVKIGVGDLGLTIEVPEKVTNQEIDYKIEGITDEAMNANKDLAAIIWNPENAISFKNSNPNLLLYIKDAKYAPAGINNVVIGATAESIILTETQSDNNFYCPKAFTARQITYSHRYRMRTGSGESRGWESIALPFDVQKIEHLEEGEIVPFANWTSSSTIKPFWLYQLGTTGFVEADGIKANTPYIISMPNNEVYRDEYILRGTITFSSTNVEVKKSDEVVKSKYGDRTFVPNFINLENNAGYYALNVNNDFEVYQGAEKEGSVFIQNLRSIHPFEAYMSSTAGTRSIGIFDGMTTAIKGIEEIANGQQTLKVYNLNGQCIKTGQSEESLKHELPSGIYIIKGQKIIIK